MRYLLILALCLALPPQLQAQSTATKLRITERVFEVDRVALAQPKQAIPEGVVDVRSLISSKRPVTLKKTATVQVGKAAYRLSERIKKAKGGADIHTWGAVSFFDSMKSGTTQHAIGTDICFLEVSPLNGLLPMVGVYHVAEPAPKRLEGEPATFVSSMIRMLPNEVRYPKKDEVVEEFAIPISTVAKMIEKDPLLSGILIPPEDPDRVLVGTHGLEFIVSYSADEDGIHLSRFRYLLSQIVDREELPGLQLDAGKPTIVVDGDTFDIEFSHDEMVVIHLTSEQERDGGNPLLLVLTSQSMDQ